MISILPTLLFLLPFLAALVAAALGWYVRGSARWVALVSLASTAALSLVTVARVLSEGAIHTYMAGWPPPLGIELVVDRLSAFVATVVSVIALITVAGSTNTVRVELPGRETLYYACVLLLVGGLMGIVVTGDLFNLFVHLEVASLAAYALVAAGGRGAPRAALAYLIIGSVGASLYLLGVGFLYAGTGTLNMRDAAALIAEAEPRLILVASLLIVAGLGIKMALFPLHQWMPAAYARSPAASAALMAPLFTKVSAYALIRVLFGVYGAELLDGGAVLDLVAWAGAIAIVMGGALAFVQRDLRRLLAYSSVGQMGFVALGVGLANAAGMTGAVLHIANDALMKGVLFLAAGIALLRFGVANVDDLNRLRGHAPWTAAAVVVAGLSLVGVPPLSGFFGKWYVLMGTIEEGRWVFTAAVVLGSLASIGYVFRIFERLFFAPAAAEGGVREGSLAAVTACVVLAAAVVLLGLGNDRVVGFLTNPALWPAGPVSE